MFSLGQFAKDTRFLIKGDASEYEVEFLDESQEMIHAINLQTGTRGKISPRSVIKILNLAKADIPPEAIQLYDEKPQPTYQRIPKKRRRKKDKDNENNN